MGITGKIFDFMRVEPFLVLNQQVVFGAVVFFATLTLIVRGARRSA